MEIKQIIPTSQPMYAIFRQDHGYEANPVVCLAVTVNRDEYGEYEEIVPMIMLDDAASDPRQCSNFESYCFEYELKNYDVFFPHVLEES